MNTTHSSIFVAEVSGYAELQREMHDALRAKHPEWFGADGNSPTCDSYESRFAELLVSHRAGERRASQASTVTKKICTRHLILTSHNKIMKLRIIIAFVIATLAAAGCSRKAPQAGPAAPEVQVTTVQPRDVPRVLERVATLDGFINANINAQVQGYIISRDYKEGSLVKKGDLLFQIDPRPFQAALAQAKGTQAKDQANWAKADADQKRALDLFNRKVISDQERDTAVAAAGSSKANVEADEAAVKQADLNLGYTKIIAPIDGLAGFANNQVGDLVGPAATSPLTTVSQIDPIKANVTVGESAFTDFFSRYPDTVQREALLKRIDFDLILGDGKVYPRKGKFYALDRNLDPKTGSIHYYVTFPNPDAILRPGQYGKVRFVPDTVQNALVVPQEAVTELQGNFQVAVVDQNKVSIRPVKTGERIGTMWQITDGLKPGDKVVVEGVQKAREGSTVKVKEWTPPAQSPAPIQSASPQKP